MLKYMLDTNICIYTLKNRPQQVRQAFKEHQDQLCISTITLMELCLGVEKSQRPVENRAVLNGFISRLNVLSFDQSAATHAGEIIADLSRVGRPIGAYDSQIAGHARSRGLVVVTNNQREFDRVPGLRSENWV